MSSSNLRLFVFPDVRLTHGLKIGRIQHPGLQVLHSCDRATTIANL